VLSVEDTPNGDLSNRMGQLTTSLLSKYGKEWTVLDRRERPLLRLLRAAPQAAESIRPQATLGKFSAGDGSVPRPRIP